MMSPPGGLDLGGPVTPAHPAEGPTAGRPDPRAGARPARAERASGGLVPDASAVPVHEAAPDVVSVSGDDVIGAWGWSLLERVGLFVFAVGLVEFALAWFPSHWALADWRFGALAASAPTLPLLTLGVAGAVSGAVARGRVGTLRLLGVALLVLSLVLLAAFVFFLKSVPGSYAAARGDGPLALAGVRKTVLRTALLILGLLPALFVTSFAALHGALVRRSPPG